MLKLANKALKLDALKQRLETMLSELTLGLNKLYLKNDKGISADIINYLQDLEHILNTGKNVLESILTEDYKSTNVQSNF